MSLSIVAIVELLSGIRSLLGFINNAAGSLQPQAELCASAVNALFPLHAPLLQEGLLGAGACNLE